MTSVSGRRLATGGFDTPRTMASTVRKGAAMAALVALVGAPTVAVLWPHLNRWEGNVLVGYRDIAGIATMCMGVTQGAIVGRRYTPAECDDANARAVLHHAEAALACTPQLRGHPPQLAMAISLTYNIGPTAYCRSTVARRFRAGDWQGACEAFLMWNRSAGHVVHGLANRRADERAKCVSGLIA